MPPVTDPVLLEVLACPACSDRPPLTPCDEGVRCDQCGRVYPMVDHVHSLLIESVLDTPVGNPPLTTPERPS